MTCSPIESAPAAVAKPWVLIAAYDVNTGASPEGHVAFHLLRELRATYRIVLVTRKNNASLLHADHAFATQCSGVHVVGYDLPRWARWRKRGARFYEAYAWLWQMSWPLAIHRRHGLVHRLALVHVLNFHNDSFPSLAWGLPVPAVWGPINHNELWPRWRVRGMPAMVRVRARLRFAARRMQWRCDPFLRLWIRRVHTIIAAGPWVDRRLRLSPATRVVRRSQLGVDSLNFPLRGSPRQEHSETFRLVCAGRLDWIKGVDLALEALALLPASFNLDIIGNGPAGKFLKALAVRLRLDERVRFTAPIPRRELPARYARADAFLFPSAEVAGLAWVEALACGLPVVGFAGESELSRMGEKMLGVHLADDQGERDVRVRAYADAILSAAHDDSGRSAIRARTLGYYAWSQLAATICDVYQTARARSA
jgi:glycosyltransferase involved in cell wall biosynthesis